MNQKHKNLQEKYLKSKKMKEQKIQLRNSFSSISNWIKSQKKNL